MGFQNYVIHTTMTDMARAKLAVSRTSAAQRGVSKRLKTSLQCLRSLQLPTRRGVQICGHTRDTVSGKAYWPLFFML